MRVLSLFDGISCARVALERAGIPVEEYLASEVDKHAIAISAKNYPDIVRLGDVREVKDVGRIDLLIGGSPCQDLSIAKKGRKGLEGDRSGLFWEYVRIWALLRPKWFVLENVASMPKADRDIITRELGVEPILIDAALVSAQSRKRLFWTNLPTVGLPEDRGIVLKDILEAEVDASYDVSGKTFTPSRGQGSKVGYVGEGEQYGQGGQAHRVYSVEGKTPTLSSFGPLVKVGHIGTTDSQTNRVYSAEGKAPTQCKGPNGGATPTLVYVGHLEGGVRSGMEGQEDLSRAHHQSHRVYGVEGKAPTLSASETSGRTHVWIPSPYEIHVPDGSSTEPVRVGHEQRRKLKNGKRADNDPTIEAVRRIETRNDDKTGTLTTVLKDNHVVDVQASRIRKLTPIECERLQGLPDGYTEGVAKTHRYKALGNAFHVDVVAHILKGLVGGGGV